MAKRSTNAYAQTVTPALAEAWLGLKYEHQRNIDRRWVDILANAMRSGRFTSNTIKFGICNGGRYLINGQHTLSAIVQSGVTITLPVVDYVFETMEDIGYEYYHEDTNRKRNMGDSIRSMGMIERLGLTKTQIDKTASALKWVKANFGADRRTFDYVTQDDQLEWVPYYEWETKAIYSAITPCTGEMRNTILTQAVFSVALITMRYVPDVSRDFWSQVAKDDGLEQYDPRKSIRNWLLTVAVRRNRRGIPSLRQVEPYAVSRHVINAWNAWCEGRSLRYVTIKDANRIVSMKQCGPFNGNQSANYLPLYVSPNIEKTPDNPGRATAASEPAMPMFA